MNKIKFKKPIILSPEIAGYEILFPFSVIINKKSFLKDEILEHQVKIGITSVLLNNWGYKIWEQKIEDIEIIKLAFPFALELIEEKIKDELLIKFEELLLTTENTKQYPYDLNKNKIDEIEGYVLNFNSNNKDTNITTNLQSNYLADEIITTRDNINALFSEKFKSKLLNLNQERYLLDLFRPVNSSEDFTHRISSISNLIGDFNIDFLRKSTQDDDKKKGSIDLFKVFLLQQSVDDIDIENITKALRNIRKIRQGYPIHTDNAKGLSEAFAYFQIDYPNYNPEIAWGIILEAYKNCLKIVLSIVKSINKNQIFINATH